MYKTLQDLESQDSISKYVMLTCILRGEKVASTQGKYCLAAYNTLQFAQKVASTAESCNCKMDGPNNEEIKGQSYKFKTESAKKNKESV